MSFCRAVLVNTLVQSSPLLCDIETTPLILAVRHYVIPFSLHLILITLNSPNQLSLLSFYVMYLLFSKVYLCMAYHFNSPYQLDR